MLDVYFNELSLAPFVLDDNDAKKKALLLLNLLRNIDNKKKASMTAHVKIAQFVLSSENPKPLAQIFSGSDHREEWALIKSYFNRSPYETTESTVCSCTINGMTGQGLAYASKADTIALSLDFPNWEAASFDITLNCKSEMDNVTSTVNSTVKNISNDTNFSYWESWLVGETPELPGFPDAKRVRGKSYIARDKVRARWVVPSGEILELDYLHKEIEKYDNHGNHLGAFDIDTGSPISGKGPVAGRVIEP